MNKKLPLLKRFEAMSDIERYSQLVKLRDLLKDVQQLSWNINNVDKKFPIDDISYDEYVDLLNVYIQFGENIDGIAHLFREEAY